MKKVYNTFMFDRDNKLPIMVWPWDDAPQSLKDLSTHGGDEDWVAHVPLHFSAMYIPWLENGSFGICDISKHELSDGSVVYIGAHS